MRLETVIGYRFKDRALLTRALTHKSFSRCNYEQLEFLGDTVLNMLTSEQIIKLNPAASEGEMSNWRSQSVCNANLAETAKRLMLWAELRLGPAELSAKQDGRNKPSILSDTVEALIGAIYLDGGLWAARDFVSRWIWN